MRYQLRAAIHELRSDEQRLAAPQEARQRATHERAAADDGVREAEQALRDARLHSRSALVEAFVNGQPTDWAMTEADATAMLQIRQDQLAHAQEICDALRAEAYDIETRTLPQRERECKRAAGALLSRSASLIAMVEKINAAYATLRDSRLMLNEIGKLVWLDDRLRSLAENSQPDDGFRYGGYTNDEAMIGQWTGAVLRLLRDGDAPLPGSTTRGNGGGPPPPGTNPVRRAGTTPHQRGGRRAGGRESSSDRPSATPKPTMIKRPGSQRTSGEDNPPLA